MKPKRIILTIMAIIVAVLLVGLAGNQDKDEFIEANLTKQSRMPYWYEN